MAATMQGKVVLITGAASATGREAAFAFAQAGCRLVLVSDDEEGLLDVGAAIQGIGGAVIAIGGDITSEDVIDNTIEDTLAAFGRIDVLVNNAGVGSYGRLAQMNWRRRQRVMEINYLAPLRWIDRVVPIMRRQGGGRIINVSSVIGRRTVPRFGAYCASKQALEAASEVLRMELAADGIQVCVLRPSILETPALDGEPIVDGPPLDRILGLSSSPRVAEAMVQLAGSGKRERVVGLVARVLKIAAWAANHLRQFVDRILVAFVRTNE
jgi:NAD(P)-dependent dehydrogenase (short-subunit alcohol dehydrogenase family)